MPPHPFVKTNRASTKDWITPTEPLPTKAHFINFSKDAIMQRGGTYTNPLCS